MVTTPGQTIATYLSKEAKSRGLTVLELSEATGIPRTTLIRRLSGKSPFTVNELAEVGDVLGMTATDIMVAAEGRRSA